jgi:hypothetical protein
VCERKGTTSNCPDVCKKARLMPLIGKEKGGWGQNI